jgi:hypothetical protein
MKAGLILFFCFSINLIYSQNIIKDKYDELFPNTKKKQIERLNHQLDSIKSLNNSLSGNLSLANEVITKQNSDLKSMHSEILNLQSNSECSLDELQINLKKLQDSINYLNIFNVVCKEELMPRNTGEEPLLINTCIWRKYKIIETGTADYRGRYSWKTEIFKADKDSLIAIDMLELFKTDSLNQLEIKINERLKEDFAYLFEANRNCFPRHYIYPGFKLKDMRFMISDNSEISFEVIYGLNSSCFAVNAASASFKIKDLVPFLAE